MDEDDAAMALWGMGQYIGRPKYKTQHNPYSITFVISAKGWEENPNRRVYETNSEQAFHTDGGDMNAHSAAEPPSRAEQAAWSVQ